MVKDVPLGHRYVIRKSPQTFYSLPMFFVFLDLNQWIIKIKIFRKEQIYKMKKE